MTTQNPTTLAGAAKSVRKRRLNIRHLASRHPNMVAGLILLLIVLAISVLAPIISTHSPTEQVPSERLKPPGSEYIFGTDSQGRDLFSRTIHGSRVSIFVGAVVALGTITIGGLIGLVCGTNQKLDSVVMRIMDGMLAFPGIILAIAIMAVRGPAVSNVIFALIVVNIPTAARVVRSVVLGISEGQFVEAARSIGASRPRVLFRHIAINSVSPAIVHASIVFAEAVLAEASLSFLGAGVPIHIPSWGGMLADSRTFLVTAPWTMLVPGAALTVTVFALNLMGDGIRDMLDPKLRSR